MQTLIPRATLYGNPSILDPEVSPDGRIISYLAPENETMNLWVAPINDISQAKCITDDRGRGLTNYIWTFLPDTIVFTQDNDGDENECLYKISLVDGQKVKLAGDPNVRVEIVKIHQKQKEWVLVGMNDRVPSQMDYYKVNLITGERISIYKNEKNYSRVIFDSNFELRAAIINNDNAEIDLYSFSKNTSIPLLEFTVPFEDSLTTYPMGFGDNDDDLIMSDSRGRNHTALVAFNLKTKTLKILAAHPKADLTEVLQSHPQTYKFEAAQFEYTTKEWIFLDKDFQNHLESLQSQESGSLNVVSRSTDDDNWILKYSPDNSTAKFFLYKKSERKKIFLFDSTPELGKYQMSKMEPITLKARDGLELVCYLGRPLNPINSDGPNPMVLLVHGGPWHRYSHEYNPTLQLYADRGYTTLCVNFRGSTGLGKDVLNGGNQEWAGKMHDDLIDACQWAIDQKIADPKRIAIYGGSYGGYAALVGLTFTPKFFACAVDIVGPSNINTLLETIPPYWTNRINFFKRRIGEFTTEEGRKALYLRSPISRVDAIEKPLLILQGANDPRVKQAEADQIFNAMKSKNIPVSYYIFPDEGHGFVRANNRIGSMALVEEFLAEHLGGRLEDLKLEVNLSSAQKQ